MTENPRFSIQFYTLRTLAGSGRNKLEADELYEAAQQALFIIESLVFFITEAGKSEQFSELSTDDLTPHFNNARSVINEFIVATIGGLDGLENRRKDLEALVEKLQRKPTKK